MKQELPELNRGHNSPKWLALRQPGIPVVLTFLAAVSFWVITSLTTLIFLNPEGRTELEVILTKPYPHDLIARIIVIIIATVAGLLLDSLVREINDVESNLRRSEERFRDLIETSSDWIWELDCNADFTYVSPRVKSLLGYSPEELIGTSAYALMPKDEAESISAHFNEFVKKAKPFRHLTNVNQHRDGHRVTLESNGEPFFDSAGELLGYRGSDRDISARIKAETEARMFKKIADSAGYGIFITSFNESVLYANQAFASCLGYKLNTVTDMNLTEMYSNNHKALVKALMRTLWEDGVLVGKELMLKRKDGSEFPALISATVVNDESGSPSLMAGTVIDLTESKRQEEEVHQNKKMASIGQLAGGIAHDFNNHLGGIIGFSELIKKRCQQTPSIDRYTDGIISTAMRSADLTEKLLAFSRRGQLQKVKLDLHQILAEASAALKGQSPETLLLVTIFKAEARLVLGDPEQLRKAFDNILSNAVDALEGERITPGRITIMTESVTVDNCNKSDYLPKIKSGKYIKVSIIDNGSGIKVGDIEHIFEPFFTTKEVGRGSGLGLAASYGTVLEHSGLIDVKSNQGSGTTIIVQLPTIGKEVKVKTGTSGKEGFGIGSTPPTIMIIEPDNVIREMCSVCLEEHGIKTLSATNATVGLELFKERYQDINLAIVNLSQPIPNKDDIISSLRKVDPKLRLLLMSGYSRSQVFPRSQDSGNIGFIKKPFHTAGLSKAVETMLAGGIVEEYPSSLAD